MAPRGRGRGSLAALLLVPPLLLAAAEQERIAFGAAEVQLPSLAIGRTYSTWHLAQAPVVVNNTSADTIRVRIDVAVPARHQLRNGALPVPDRSWIQLESERLVVPPHCVRYADALLSLPYQPDLAGHLYQVDLLSTVVSADGRAVDTAHRHRLLFTVEMDYRDDTEIDFASRRTSPHSPLL